MDVTLDDITIIRIKLDPEELRDLVSGERIFIDLDQSLQIEIYHAPLLNYEAKEPGSTFLNGEDNER